MKIFIFLLFLALVSCKRDKEANKSVFPETHILAESVTKKFPLDNETSFQALYMTAWEDSLGKEFLIFLNHNKPSIQFYDMESQKLVKEIKLSVDGPDGLGKPSGLIPFSDKYCFVISSGQYRISLINNQGKLLRAYRVLDGKMNITTGMLRPFTTSPGTMIGNKLYFNVAPDRDVYKKTYYEGNTNLVLNIEQGKYEYFNNYPEVLKDGVWGVTGVSFSTAYNKNKKKFIYSFAILDSLVTYDPDTKKRESFYAGSRFIEAKINPMEIPDNAHDLEYALTTPYYGAIVYDHYRDVYYRFVKHAIDYKDADGQVNEFHEKPISIIMLDKNFNILGEKMLPKDKFVDFLYFVATEGLFVSTGNPANPNLNQDIAEYVCFKIEKVN